ncbi:dd-gdca protein [Anaeramoeba flamelloides]|uniref:Dd-gdca protein n=1 Tax=Anaeramoeba flamelloides TaxID=1746091 RepID=A0AAV7ZPB9_9EUKA|nr:dd-gdca protein [Anaeramoeba flamelloides]
MINKKYFFLLLVFLFLVKNAQGLSCTNNTYVGLGSSCDATSVCYDNLWCNTKTNKCERDNTGTACTDGTDCYGAICANNVCSGAKDNGDLCDLSSECLGGQCHSGVCKGLSYGLPYECYSHIEKSLVDLGVVCSGGYICDVNSDSKSGNCTRRYSKPKGSYCANSEVCLLGLACQNGVCTDSYPTCDSENGLYCPLESNCICENGKQTGTCQQTINYDCKYQIDQYVDCLEESNCHGETLHLKGTCNYENCYQEFLNFECCKIQNDHTSTHYVLNGMECLECNMNLTYVGLNSACDPPFGLNCYPNLWCNENTNKCEKDNTGSKCTSGSNCSGGVCSNSKCTNKKDNGDSCNVYGECWSNICTDKTCRGKKEGETCDPTKLGANDCDYGLFCDSQTSKCIKEIEPGSECLTHLEPYFQDWYIACTPGFFCDHNDSSFQTGICRKLFSVGANDNCGISLACEIGLACQDNKCVSNPTTCDLSTKHCPYLQYCSCNSNNTAGSCVTMANPNCQYTATELVDCMIFYGAPFGEIVNTDSRLFSYCHQQMQDFQCCNQDGYSSSYFLSESISCEACSQSKKYKKVGESCSYFNDQICYDNLWCNTKTNKCERDNTGSACTDGSDCYGAVCANKVCSGMKDNGDSCTISDECYSNNCKANICIGVKEGEACDPTKFPGRKCDQGLYCDVSTMKCKATIGKGEDCLTPIMPYYTDLSVICQPGYICDHNSEYTFGICERPYTLLEGEECGSSKVCELGLACQNKKCSKSYDSCDLVLNFCPEGFYCECSANNKTGTCIQNDNSINCQTELSFLMNCLEFQNCQLETDLVDGTCIYDKCFDTLKFAECCKQTNHESKYYLNHNINCKTCSSNVILSGINGTCGNSSYKCYDNLWCNTKTLKCEKDNTGSACTDGSDCYGGVCANKICSGKKDNGDSCLINDECWGNNCTSNICRGKKKGENCDPSILLGNECDKGLFCDSQTSKCILPLKENEECFSHLLPYFSDFSVICEPGLICDASDSTYTVGYCKKPFSVSTGGDCGVSNVCLLGLACQKNKCTKSFETCDLKENFCPEGYYCKCNANEIDGTCKQIANTDCQLYADDMINCIGENNCPIDYNFVPGDCAYQNCFEEIQSFECCQQQNHDKTYFLHNKIDYNTGSKCTNGTDCYGGICINNECTGMRDNGDLCQVDEECRSKNCNDNSGKCRGKAINVDCDPSSIFGNECDIGLFCDSQTSKCISQLKENEDCLSHLFPYISEIRQICKAGYLCDIDEDYEHGYCRRRYSGEVGDSCGFQEICQLGLSCQDGKCSSSFDKCNDKTKICPEGYYCQCNEKEIYGTCKQIANTDCLIESQEYIDCIQLKGCMYDNKPVYGTCSYTYCYNQLLNLECCKQTNFTESYYLNNGLDCGTCPYQITYSTVNGYCEKTNNTSYECYDNLWCNNNKCQEDNTGSNCTDGTECYGGICVNQKCSVMKTNGDSCQVNAECYSNNCTSGICRGKPFNTDCSPYNLGGNDCDKGLYCDSQTSKCTPELTENTECFTHLSPYFMEWKLICQAGYICDLNLHKTSGVCKKYFYGGEGDSCGMSETCQLGLACQDGKCSKTFSKCNKNSKFCPFGYNCECNQDKNTGNCIQVANTDCQSEASVLNLCQRYMNCPYEPLGGNGTCIFEKCYDQLRGFECCLQLNNDDSYFPHTGMNCQSCGNIYQYSGVGEYCNLFGNAYCYDNLWCNNNINQCEEDNTGSDCKYGVDCYGGICENNKCSGMKDNGDKCTSNQECWSNDCNGGTCQGKAKDQDCDPIIVGGRDCDKGLYCDSQTKKCQKELSNGEECSRHLSPYFVEIDSVCADGYLCEPSKSDFSQGYCRKYFSGGEGDSCGTSKSCQLGFGCQDGKCTKHIYSCDLKSKNCPWGSYCKCHSNQLSGVCKDNINENCQNQADDYITCLITNKCGSTTDFVYGTCEYIHCFKQMQNFQCCLRQGYDTSYFVNKGIDCNIPSPTPTHTPNPSPSTLPTPTRTTNINNNTNSNLKLGFGLGIPIALVLIVIGFVLFSKKIVISRSRPHREYQEL